MIKTKIDIFEELKKNGYSSTKIINSKILSSGTVKQIRESSKTGYLSNISIESLNRICLMCKKQPGDIIKVDASVEEKLIYFNIPE